MTAAATWELILAHLKQPEYIHVLLNPVPVYGLALGAMALVLAMALRSRPAQIVALTVIFIGAASAIPVEHFGDEAYDVIESQMATDQADAWLDAHGQRAARAMPAYYALAGLALVAIGLPWKWPRSRAALNRLTLALTVVDFGIGGWIAYAGGQAMHKEFRSGNSMPPEPVGGYEKMR